MAENDAGLQSRVERLEGAVEELTHRVEVMDAERGARSGGACHPEPAKHGEGPVSHVGNGSFAALRGSAASPAQDDRSVLSLAGSSLLIFAGAYVLRALTESGVIPKLGGVFAGVAYAAFWILV